MAPDFQEKVLDRGHLTGPDIKAIAGPSIVKVSKFVRLSYLRFLVVVVAANINPLPAIVCPNLTPAGIIRVIVDQTTKAECEEIAVVEPMVETVVVPIQCKVIAIEGTAALNTSIGHRRCGHPAPVHHGAPSTPGLFLLTTALIWSTWLFSWVTFATLALGQRAGCFGIAI